MGELGCIENVHIELFLHFRLACLVTGGFKLCMSHHFDGSRLQDSPLLLQESKDL